MKQIIISKGSYNWMFRFPIAHKRLVEQGYIKEGEPDTAICGVYRNQIKKVKSLVPGETINLICRGTHEDVQMKVVKWWNHYEDGKYDYTLEVEHL